MDVFFIVFLVLVDYTQTIEKSCTIYSKMKKILILLMFLTQSCHPSRSLHKFLFHEKYTKAELKEMKRK